MASPLLQRTVARSTTALLRGCRRSRPSAPLSLLPSLSSSSSPSSGNNTSVGIHFFSSDTHDDFAPKRKVVDGVDEAIKLIEEHVQNNHIMLYMKGSPAQPMCGFSGTTIQILQKEGVDFSSVNVLDYPTIRDGVKKYSQWPTIPQLYVNGEFIGGCDIIKSMHESGELKALFEEEKKE